MILPYMAYSPPARMMSDEQRGRLQDFAEDPIFSELRYLEEALTVFAYAHQLSKHIWTKYSTFGMIIDPLNKRRRDNAGHLELLNGIAARAKKIESLSRTIQFYQCLWWGAEKIWAGELVRLAATWYSDASSSALLKLAGESKIIAVPGAKISLDSLDKPVLFSLAHIYRDPVKQRLRIMGTFLEILEDNGKPKEDEHPEVPLFLGEMEKISRTLPRWLPSLPPGRSFNRLKGVPEGEEFEFDASLLAGYVLCSIEWHLLLAHTSSDDTTITIRPTPSATMRPSARISRLSLARPRSGNRMLLLSSSPAS